jgi:hypothetical protein
MFALALAAAVLAGSWTHIPDGGWEPSSAELKRAKASLHAAVIAQATPDLRKSLPPWGKYAFQYQGRLLDGRKVIYVNAFCDIPAYAGKTWVGVMDGGPCYFAAFFDVKTGKYIGVAFNGYG